MLRSKQRPTTDNFSETTTETKTGKFRDRDQKQSRPRPRPKNFPKMLLIFNYSKNNVFLNSLRLHFN